MATCVRCGRELPSFSLGTPSPLCRDCNSTVNARVPGPVEPVDAPTPVRSSQPFSLTKIIFGVNIAVFVTMALSGVSLMQPATWQLIKWGANWGPLSLGSQPWRMLTSNYVHIGIIHIFFNMWCLWNLGRLAERIFDRWTYLLVYTATGIGGSLASLWWHPLTVGAGASGAIFGLAGALIAVLYLGKLPIAGAALKPTLKSLLSFAGYNLFFGLSAGIDNAAHLGGLATGLALGAVLARTIAAPPEIRERMRNYAAVGIVVLVLVAGGYLQQKTGKTDSAASLQDPMVAFKHGNFGQSIPGLRQAAERDPTSAPTRYLLGLAYVGARQPDAAIASFQEALSLKPDDAQAEFGLGLAYQAEGMQPEAEEAFQKAAALEHEARQ
jgi:membrane associated rhomboid family serine protease